MGSGFGEAVSSLLATYGRCLKLLKAFKGHTPPQNGEIQDGSVASRSQVSLRQSIKSDRSRIRNAYSTRLYREGSQLSKGDSMSRSKLRGITRKIKAALVNILHLAKTQQPAIDYNALTTLSNASRIDAIRTMDDLSQRLQKPSHASLRSSSSKSSATSKSRSCKHGKRHSSEQEEVPSVDTRKRPTAQKSEGRSKGRESSRRSSSDSQSPIRPPPDLQIKSKPATPDVVTKRAPGKLVKQSPHQETVVHNRISYVSISSDSTKLGEIPYRGSRLVRHHDSDEASISQQATYPLYTYKPAHHEKTGLFRRLFR